MSKSIDKLTITQLLELKTATDLISDKYANELAANVPVGASAIDFFNENSKEIDEKLRKRMNAKNLSDKITKQLEIIISEYYD